MSTECTVILRREDAWPIHSTHTPGADLHNSMSNLFSLFSRMLTVLVLVSAASIVTLPVHADTAHPEAISASASDDTIRLEPGESSKRIVPEAYLFEDSTADLSLNQVLQSNGWEKPSTNALAFGYSLSAWWVRWQLENPLEREQTLVIDLGQPRHDLAQWYIIRDNSTKVEEVQSGDRLPFDAQPLGSRNTVAPVKLAPGEMVEVVARLTTHDGLFEAMPITLYTEAGFERVTDTENKVLMLFHGGVMALALYNLLLFFATREKAFGLYTHYLFWFLAWSLTWRGYTFQHLWPNAPAFTNDFLTIAAAGTFASVGLFCIYYLRLHETAPRWVLRLMQALIVANIAVALFALTGQYFNAVVAGWFTGIAVALLALGVATWLALKGFRPAYFFILAFTLLAAGVTAYILQMTTVLPTNWFTTWGIQIGSALEVLILALGLADSMNRLKAEKLQAERQARQAQQGLTERLEKEVRERTRDLHHANQRLQALAITDELTGAFNRRHFNDFCDKALSRELRDEPLAFCMFDIDHFKPFNDQLGHQLGDQALKTISHAIQNQLKRSSDLLFRLGGEEFGVLFTANSLTAAQEFAEQLREAIRAEKIYHPTNKDHIVTASFGLVWCSPESSTNREELYTYADKLLYEAKDHGRDQVVVGKL